MAQEGRAAAALAEHAAEVGEEFLRFGDGFRRDLMLFGDPGGGDVQFFVIVIVLLFRTVLVAEGPWVGVSAEPGAG